MIKITFPSKVFIRIRKFSLSFSICFAMVQRLDGITSLMQNGKHIILWDLDDCTLEQAKKALRKVQKMYNLSHIYIVSDKEGSYRAYCYSQVDFSLFLHILLDTEYLDPNFFDYTVRRKKATLRTSNKKDRCKQQRVAVLSSYLVPIPKDMIEQVIYDTGLTKTEISIILGDA